MSFNISVIIPNYNHALYLKERIESVLNQTHKPYEIIILDDCSTDNSVEIIETYFLKYPEIQYVKNEINSGSTFSQWNKGVALAKGELIWIAESDDFAKLNFLEIVTKPFLNNNKVVLSYCQSNKVNELSEVIGNWKFYTEEFVSTFFDNLTVIKGERYIEQFLIHKNTIPNASSVIFKREAFIKTDGACVIKYIGDWLVWIKLACVGDVAFNPMILNNFRSHSESVIAKANFSININEFKDWFGFQMRKELVQFLKNKKIKLTPKANISNAK